MQLFLYTHFSVLGWIHFHIKFCNVLYVCTCSSLSLKLRVSKCFLILYNCSKNTWSDDNVCCKKDWLPYLKMFKVTFYLAQKNQGNSLICRKDCNMKNLRESKLVISFYWKFFLYIQHTFSKASKHTKHVLCTKLQFKLFIKLL